MLISGAFFARFACNTLSNIIDRQSVSEKARSLYLCLGALCAIGTATQFLIWTGITATFYDSITGAAIHPARFLDWIVTIPTTLLIIFLSLDILPRYDAIATKQYLTLSLFFIGSVTETPYSAFCMGIGICVFIFWMAAIKNEIRASPVRGYILTLLRGHIQLWSVCK